MNRIQDEWSNYTRIIKMIAEEFGNRCEVVLHDLTKEYDQTIVAIENNHITGREVGGCGSNLGLPFLSGSADEGDAYNYMTQTKDGKVLRSSTTFLHNENGDVVGCICINYDITDLMMANQIIKDVAMNDSEPPREDQEIFANNVGEILDHLIGQCQGIIGKSPAMMTKADKIHAIEFFDAKGAFLITKAGERICEYLGISKFTLYNYLEIARKKGDAS